MTKIYLPETACKMVKAILKRGQPALIRENFLIATDGKTIGIHKLMDTVDTPIYVTPEILTEGGTHLHVTSEGILTYGDSKFKQKAYGEGYLYGATFCDIYENSAEYIAPYIEGKLVWHKAPWKKVIPSESELNYSFSNRTTFEKIGTIIEKMKATDAVVNTAKDCSLITVSENCIIVVMNYRYC